MAKILFVIDDIYPGFGGIASVTEGFIEELLNRGHAISVAAGQFGDSTAPPEVRVHRFPVWQPGKKMQLFALPKPNDLRALVAQVDIVQVMTPTPMSWMALGMARQLGKFSIIGFYTQRESLTFHLPPVLRGPVGALIDTYYRALYRRGDMATPQTNFSARIFREYSNIPIEIVSAGVSLEQFNPGQVTPDQIKSFRASCGVANDGFLLLSVGRLAHEKDPLSMLRVAEQLVRQQPKAIFAFGGTGPLKDEMAAEIFKLGLEKQIKLLGFISDAELPCAYAASDLFALSSPTELQGIVLLEAMAMGAPLFVRDIDTSAATEALDGGRTGLGFDPTKPDQAATALSDLLNDPHRLAAMRMAALEFVQTHDVRHSVDKLERLYAKFSRPQPLKQK